MLCTTHRCPESLRPKSLGDFLIHEPRKGNCSYIPVALRHVLSPSCQGGGRASCQSVGGPHLFPSGLNTKRRAGNLGLEGEGICSSVPAPLSVHLSTLPCPLLTCFWSPIYTGTPQPGWPGNMLLPASVNRKEQAALRWQIRRCFLSPQPCAQHASWPHTCAGHTSWKRVILGAPVQSHLNQSFIPPPI